MPGLAAIMKAFGENTRLRILRLIALQELAVNELVEAMEIPQSRISRHLAVLRHAGIVRDRREGNWIYYSMLPDRIHPFVASLWEAVRAHQDDGEFFPADLVRLTQTLAKRQARSKAYFDVVLTEWDRIRRTYIDEALSLQVLSSLIRPEAVAVDVGTGTGEVLLALAHTAAKVIGIDSSEKMLAACRQRVAENELTNVELVLGNAEVLPLGDASCDTALCSMLLHHLGDPGRGVAEMARIVKPGGRVIIGDLVKHDFDWTREIMADVWLGFTEPQIRDWLAAAGLVDVAYTCTIVPSPVDPDSAPRLRTFIATGTKPRASNGRTDSPP